MVKYRQIIIFLVSLFLATSCGSYSRILEKVYKNDQGARQWCLKMNELSPDELIESSAFMEKTDSINQNIVSSILDKEGWPANITKKANQAIWIVIDHADSDYQLKYMDIVQDQANLGNVSKSDYAVLYDRLMKNLGKPQKYGTQIHTAILIVGETMTDSTYLWPVEDGEHLDSLRRSVGLPTIQDYFHVVKESTGLNVIWDKDKTVADFLGQ